jgi:hypothetical protein
MRLLDVEGELARLDVYVFSDIATPRFMCPAGVNIALDEQNAVGAHVAKISLASRR